MWVRPAVIRCVPPNVDVATDTRPALILLVAIRRPIGCLGIVGRDRAVPVAQ